MKNIFPSIRPALAPLAFAGCSIFLLYYVFKPWGIFYDAGDTGAFDFGEYFFYKNFHWGILPSVNLRTDMILYPFGIDFAANLWSLERHYFTFALTHAFGYGPWLQLYCWMSFVLSGLLVFFITRREIGSARSWYLAFATSFLNAAALYKYPWHLNQCVIHWAAANVAMDFIMAKRFLENRLSLPFILTRIIILLLGLGMDIGYIAGFGLTSITITLLWMLAKVGPWNIIPFFRDRFGKWRCEAGENPGLTIFQVFLIAAISWLYIPILASVTYKFIQMQLGWNSGHAFWWANPLRIILPWFPFLNADHGAISRLLKDNAELAGNMSPGWIIVIPGLLGSYFIIRNRLRAYYPLLIFLLILLLHHPNFEILRIFPWWGEIRVSGRLSLVFPTLMSLIALAAIEPCISWCRQRRWVLLLVLPMAFLEIFGIYSRAGSFNPIQKNEMTGYVDTIKRSAGAALFEWPFCIAAGNGVGSEELCPFFTRNEATIGLERLHGKKLISGYFGRLIPFQVKPFLDQGWPLIFRRLLGEQFDSPSGTRNRFRSCFNEAEWEFFLQVLKNGDFSGVQLYKDLVDNSCTVEFYRRIGASAVRTNLPGTGETEFIPKPAEWFVHVDEDALKKLLFIPDIKPGTYDLLSALHPAVGWFEGKMRNADSRFHGRPVRKITENKTPQYFFPSKKPGQRVEFSISLITGLAGQTYKVVFNGEKVAEGSMKPLEDENIAFSADTIYGINSILIKFSTDPSLGSAISGYISRNGGYALLKSFDWHRHWTSYARGGIFALITGFKIKITAENENQK